MPPLQKQTHAAQAEMGKEALNGLHLVFLWNVTCAAGPPEYAALNCQSRCRGGRQIRPGRNNLSLLAVLRLQRARREVREPGCLCAWWACAALRAGCCSLRCGFRRRCAGFRHGSTGVLRCRRCRLTCLQVGDPKLSARMHHPHNMLPQAWQPGSLAAWQPGTTTSICRTAIALLCTKGAQEA